MLSKPSTHTFLDITYLYIMRAQVNPRILIETRYARTDTFMGRKLYVIQLPATDKMELLMIWIELETMKLGLKLWDGYWPLLYQWKLWNYVIQVMKLPNPYDYVADPRTGKKHTTGCPVNLTIINLIDDTEIEMPTAFDAFTPQTHANCLDVNPCVQQNKTLLQSIMEKHYFKRYAYE